MGALSRYDPVGNRTDQQTDNAPRASSHNVRNQLTSTDPGGKVFIRGSLNEAASVTIQGKPATVAADNTYSGTAEVPAGTTSVAIQATDPSGNVRTSTYDVSASGTGAAFTYDANGNMAQKVEGGDTWAYEWTVENELKRVLKNAVEQASFKYDPAGRRVEKVAGGVTTTYAYDGKNILRQVAGATTTLFVQGAGIDEPLASEVSGTLSYYHADALGSIVKVTDQSVSTVHSYQYDAWGNILSGGTLAGPAFTGREWDPETQLYYYRARFYDPTSGTFVGEDSFGPVFDPNLYKYANANPAVYVDPDGRMAQAAAVAAGPVGIVVAVALTVAVAIITARNPPQLPPFPLPNNEPATPRPPTTPDTPPSAEAMSRPRPDPRQLPLPFPDPYAVTHPVCEAIRQACLKGEFLGGAAAGGQCDSCAAQCQAEGRWPIERCPLNPNPIRCMK
ncbi:MAG: RHS repeat-associated core domain-containing protein [Vicinamibacteria bacterium]